MGNVIQKKCCEEIGSLFFTTEPLELKSKRNKYSEIYILLYQMSCVAQTQSCTIQKSYANDMLI